MKVYKLKKCLSCSKPLAGRLDKKFCDDQCRSEYNNQNKRSYEREMGEVNKAIRRNRTILKSLCPLGKATVRREVLTEMGFDFNIFTTIFPTRGNVYYFSYEYGFSPINEPSLTNPAQIIQKAVIVQRQSFMKKPLDPWTFIKKK